MWNILFLRTIIESHADILRLWFFRRVLLSRDIELTKQRKGQSNRRGLMISAKWIQQNRLTFAVGQGLFHYEEISLDHGMSRPLTIVYDTGSFSPHTHENDVAYRSVEQVKKRLEDYCSKTIDYLILSHFHADHYNLMSRLITNNKVRYFIAPLLTPTSNSFEIAAVAYEWLSNNSNLSEANEEKKLITEFVDKGTDGFAQQLFREHHKPNQFIYITNEPKNTDNDQSIVHFIPDEPDDGNGSGNGNGNNSIKTISHDQPIVIQNRYCHKFWKMVFYCNTPDINPPQYWKAAKGSLKQKLIEVWNNHSDDPKAFKKYFEDIFSKRTYFPTAGKKKQSKRMKSKKVTFDDVFGYANANMTSLTMYSGTNWQQNKIDIIDPSFSFGHTTGPRINLDHGVEKLLVHTAKESSNQKRYSLDETSESEAERLRILRFLYRSSNLFFIPHKAQRNNSNLCWCYSDCNSQWPMQSYIRPSGTRDCYWSWMGFGDMNFEDEAVADKLIEHFKKHGNLLERVGCCSAPHHGSHNGFATNKIPSEFPGAICLISCDPNREGYGHPRIEALSSILQGGMLPTLVSDQEDSTFYETLCWKLR